MSRDPKFDAPEMSGLTPEERLLWAIFAAPEIAVADLCNECNRPVPEDDAGPSCGAHVLHIECASWFGCHACYLVRAEIP